MRNPQVQGLFCVTDALDNGGVPSKTLAKGRYTSRTHTEEKTFSEFSEAGLYLKLQLLPVMLAFLLYNNCSPVEVSRKHAQESPWSRSWELKAGCF